MNITNYSTLGVRLPNGTQVTHGLGGNVRRPLSGSPVEMNELYVGSDLDNGLTFKGQFGFIEFNTECRLPRHVHISLDADDGTRSLLPERILVLNGVGLTELGGEIFLVAPGSLVDIPPGLPHTWNACPPGIALPDGTVSTGHFTMIYNYSENTRFFPTEQTGTLSDAGEYIEFKGDIERIRFPVLDAAKIVETGVYVWNKDMRKDLTLQNNR